MNKKPIRGEIWLTDLDPVVGHEQAKLRPCLIISDDDFNSTASKLAVIIPLTSQYRNTPWYVEVDPPNGGLNKISYIMCNHVRTVSHLRFSKKCGLIDNDTIKQVEFRICMLFGLTSSSLQFTLNND